MNLTLRRGHTRPAAPNLIGGAPRSGRTVDPATVRPATRHGGLLVESAKDGVTFDALDAWITRVLMKDGVSWTAPVSADTRNRYWAPDELIAEPIITAAVRAGEGYETMTNVGGMTIADLRRFVTAARMLDEVQGCSHVLVSLSPVTETRLERAHALAVRAPGVFRG